MFQVPYTLAERACIDGADHLTENLGWLTGNGDFRMEAGLER